MSAKKEKPIKEKKPISKKKQKRIRTAITWAVIIIILIAAFVAFSAYSSAKMREAAMVIYAGDIYTVGTRDVANTISATGLIESDEDTTKKVYSTMSYKIDTVNVSLGDKVAAGDLLCTYETETLDRAIREKELSMTSSERAAALNLASAKLNYDTYLSGMNDGINASLKNAQSSYDSALDKYNNAKEDYDEYLAKSESAEIIALNAAKRDLDKAQKTYDDFKKEIDDGANIKLAAAKRALDSAEKTYLDFKKEFEEGTSLKLVTAKRSLDTAKENYEDYKKLVDDDETAELISASANADAAYSAYRAANATLEQLEAELEKHLQELEEIDAAIEEEMNKPAEDQLPYKIEALEGKYERKQKTIAEVEEKIAKQADAVEDLTDSYYTAEDAYAKASKTADLNLKSYQTTYENAKDNYDAVLEGLEDTLESYEKAYNDAKDNYTTTSDSLEDTLEGYETTLSKALDAYETAKDNVENQLESYENALTSAERALSDAENALKNADITASNQLESYRIAYENAKNNASTALTDYQLANLYEDLEKTKVTAPISGTVTAIYATEGESISGVMFVIEDTENLVVTSTVKAYDLDRVAVGMKVKIETDASGDDIFYGVIESVSPTAIKDASGSVISTNDAEFETVVRVTDKSERLKIGVSARIEYIVEEQSGVIAVPESAIFTEGGESFVLTVSEDEEGKTILGRTAVKCGMNDGIYTVCEGLAKGTRIADNAENYLAKEGLPLGISSTDTSANVFDFASMMPMGAR